MNSAFRPGAAIARGRDRMPRLGGRLDRRAAELARLDDKDDAHVRAMLRYSAIMLAVVGVLLWASIHGIHHARTNAGSGVGWFAAAITGLAFVAVACTVLSLVGELWRRRRRNRH